MPRISVVIPIYNVEDYLDDCLLSVEAQDCGDFEAICVNDGSSDGSRAILERWAQAKPWITVIDKENGGLSSARNAGIRAATGEFVCFLDSDDRLLPEACRRITESFDATGAEVLVFGGYALPRQDTTPWLEHALTPPDAVYEGFSDELVFGEQTRPFAWRTAARKDFLLGSSGDELLFDEGVRYGEDLVFQFHAYAVARRAATISDRLYEYRVRRVGSLMSDAREDGEDLLQPNLKIMAHVLNDYQRLGLLEQCQASMLRWLARFIGHDALMLDDDLCASTLAQLGELMRTYWAEDDVRAADLDEPVRRTLLAAMHAERMGVVHRKTLWVRLHLSLFWQNDVASKALRRLHGKG